MKTAFNTSRYQFSHGHAPRGRGTWAFEDRAGNVVFWSGSNVTLTEAKRQFLASGSIHAAVWVSP